MSGIAPIAYPLAVSQTTLGGTEIEVEMLEEIIVEIASSEFAVEFD